MLSQRGQLTLGNQLSILLDHKNGLPLVEMALKYEISQSKEQNVLNRSTQILIPDSKSATTTETRTTLPLGDKFRVLHFVDREPSVTANCNRLALEHESRDYGNGP